MKRVLVVNTSRQLADPSLVSAVAKSLEKTGAYEVIVPPARPANSISESSDVAGRIAELRTEDIDVFWPARGGKAAIELFDEDLDIDVPFTGDQMYIGMSDHTLLMHYWTFNSPITCLYGPVFRDIAKTKESKTCESALAAINDAQEFTLSASTQFDDWVNNKYGQTTDGAWAIRPGAFKGPYIVGLLSRMLTAQMMNMYGSLSGYLLLVEQLHTSPDALAADLRSFLKMQPDIAGIVFGRFTTDSGITRDILSQIANSIPELRGKIILANYDFGHTYPITTIPVRGKIAIELNSPELRITY